MPHAFFTLLIMFIHRYANMSNLTQISKVKEDLVMKLTFLVDEERRQLERDLGRKLEELDDMKKRHREEEDLLEQQVQLLSEKLDNLHLPPILNR